jgi:hypothetical protein
VTALIYFFRAVSGPLIRSTSASVAAVIPREMLSPATTIR